jgi:Zn-dependent M28 family amino/carboxypeptidase
MPATRFGRTLVLFLALGLASAQQTFSPTPDVYRALERISAASLRGNLSFVAAELLEGRDTPSRGLDIAATYIAAQFRAAGLEPAGDDGYFQTAKMLRIVGAPDSFELRIQDGSRTLATVGNGQAIVLSRGPLELSGALIYKIRSIADVADVRAGDAKGKVVVLAASRENRREIAKAAAALQPAAFLEAADREEGSPQWRLIDADETQDPFGGVARLIVRDADVRKVLREAKAGETGLTISVKLATSTLMPATVRNVIGLLRGSDPVLRDQYILLTAHYDHLGTDGPGRVFEGANDDGSGTVSVMEIGKALAAMPVHPKRSIVFMTFFGEEEGSLGSLYYARHPVFPLRQTVADLNLEQVGRTDSNAGPEVSNASLTGFEYSSIARVLQQAGKLTGVKVYEAPNGDDFFNRSDNQTFAERGIPAHTIVVAFEYPDYHAVGDTWQKIDYDNMAKVDRMIALGSIMLADSVDAPHWNRKNPKAARYLKAR